MTSPEVHPHRAPHPFGHGKQPDLSIAPRIAPTWTAWEPCHSFVTRWAALVGHLRVQVFCRSLELDAVAVLEGRANAEVARLARLPADAFDAATVVRPKNEPVRLGPHEISRRDWDSTTSRVCPRCLAADAALPRRPGEHRAFLRAWWSLRFVVACPWHGTPLVELQKHPLGSGLPLAMRLAASRQLDDMHVNSGPEQYVLGRIGAADPMRVPILDSMPLSTAMRVMELVGSVHRPDTEAGVDAPADRRTGLAMLEGDAVGLFRHLDGCVAEARGARAKWGAADVYGRLYSWLAKRKSEPGLESIIRIVREHALANVPLSPDVPLFGASIGRRRIYTVRHLSKMCGIVPDKVERILILAGKTGMTTCGLRCFQAEEAEELSAFLSGTMPYEAARTRLGLSRAAMAGLFAAGILRPLFLAGDGSFEHVFQKLALDEFVAMMAGDAPGLDLVPKGTCDIVQVGNATRTSAADVARLVIAGRVKCVGRLAKPGLSALVFRTADVRAALREGHKGNLTLVEAAARLGTTFYICRALVEAGHIPAVPYEVPFGASGNARHVLPADLEAFSADHEGAFELAVRLGTHPRVLLPKLSRSGIEPAIAKADVGKSFFHRSQVAEIELLVTHTRRRNGQGGA